jgi:hypothetical protein
VKRALEIAAGFSADGGKIIEFIAEQFPLMLTDFSRNPSLLHKSALIRQVTEKNAAASHRTRMDRWADNQALLAFYRQESLVEKARIVLDRMEDLAEIDETLRREFLRMLEDPQSVDPAWDEEDVLRVRARLYELDGRCEEAAEVVTRLGHRFRTQERWIELHGLMAQLSTLDPKNVHAQSLIGRLPALVTETVEPAPLQRLLDRQRLRVLFIGGGEMLERYDLRVEQDLHSRYGDRLELTFHHDAWASNWRHTFEILEREIVRADVIVLSNRMRTMLGCKLRETINTQGKTWGACTAVGLDTMIRSIESTASRFAELAR